MLHSVTVVKNIEDTQKFYSDILGMTRLRYRSFEDGSANGFSGVLPEERGFSLELVQKPGGASGMAPPIRIGSGFRHYVIAVPSLEASLTRSMSQNVQLVEGEGPEGGEVYIEDPDGYLWEPMPFMDGTVEPFRAIALRVSDLDASLRYYTDLLGMKVIKREDGPGYRRASVCWGSPKENTAFELTQVLGSGAGPIETGSNSYVQVAVSTQDVYKTTEEIRAGGGRITREPAPVPGIGTKVAKTADPDGWVIAFVDYDDFILELCSAGSLKDPAYCAVPQ